MFCEGPFSLLQHGQQNVEHAHASSLVAQRPHAVSLCKSGTSMLKMEGLLCYCVDHAHGLVMLTSTVA